MAAQVVGNAPRDCDVEKFPAVESEPTPSDLLWTVADHGERSGGAYGRARAMDVANLDLEHDDRLLGPGVWGATSTRVTD